MIHKLGKNNSPIKPPLSDWNGISITGASDWSQKCEVPRVQSLRSNWYSKEPLLVVDMLQLAPGGGLQVQSDKGVTAMD